MRGLAFGGLFFRTILLWIDLTNEAAQKQPDAKTPEFLVKYRTETANTHQWRSGSEQQLTLRWEGGGKWDSSLGWYVLDLDLGPIGHFHPYVHDQSISFT